MSAIRVARGFTGRDVIVKFEGCYHGHADHLLVKAGSGLATFGVPDSAGVPEGTAQDDAHAAVQRRRRARARSSRRAARRSPPSSSSRSSATWAACRPSRASSRRSSRLCKEHGALSIFDEVMTGCRLARGGAQERFGLAPDLTTLGKIVGGGMPLAAYGGRDDVMSVVAPLGPVYQAGTLSGNPRRRDRRRSRRSSASMPELYEKLEHLGARARGRPARRAKDAGVAACVQRVGSMITLFFTTGPVRSWNDAAKCDTKRFARWHAGLLARGVYWPPSQFEAAFISAAHTEDDIDAHDRSRTRRAPGVAPADPDQGVVHPLDPGPGSAWTFVEKLRYAQFLQGAVARPATTLPAKTAALTCRLATLSRSTARLRAVDNGPGTAWSGVEGADSPLMGFGATPQSPTVNEPSARGD